MKKTSEELAKAQEEALAYREKLDAGEIRLVPEKRTRPAKKRPDEQDQDQIQP